jgi:thiamine-monophosphate kinase
MKNTLLNDVGEFRFLKRLENKLQLKKSGKSRIVVDIGDDAFAAEFSGDKILVATNDVLVENVHFRKCWIRTWELGYKAVAVNLSDLAAMGGAKPLYAFVGLAVPGRLSVNFVDKLYSGMARACSQFGCRIAGGDTVSSLRDIVISITLLGKIDRKRIVTRSGAKPGDLIYVTGCFGDSAAGLRLLESGRKTLQAFEKKLVKKHVLPFPRIDAAMKLSKTGAITSMIDSSDGLAASLKFITDKSRVGAEISTEKIPVSEELTKLSSKNRRINPLKLALGGGEDYELVFTASPEAGRIVQRTSKDITLIGAITKSSGIKYLSNGNKTKIALRGYQAFN